MVGLTSFDLIQKAHRLGLIMDIASEEDDPGALAELDAEAVDILETLAEETPDKLDALRAVYLRLDAEATLLRDEEKLLANKRRARESGRDRVKAFMLALLQGSRDAGQGSRVSTPTNTFWLQSSIRLVGPDDPTLWPRIWQRQTVTPDKKAASAALKGGHVEDGFRLEETDGVRFR